MRKQILLAACLVAIALVVGVFSGARSALTHSFASIEADEARRSIERVRQALWADLRQLEEVAEDYASWDELYDFVQERGSPDFLEHYFSRSGLDNIHVDVVWVVDGAGRTLVQLGTEGPPGSLNQLGQATLQGLMRYRSLLIGDLAVQLVRLPGGPMAVAVRPISRDLPPGMSDGFLMFGRYLDSHLIERLGRTTQLPIRITALDERGKPLLAVPPAVGDWLAAPHRDSDLLVQAGDPTRLASHVLLRDAEGKPLVVLSTTVSRAALQVAKGTITWVVATLLAGFTALVVLLVSVLNRSWRNRAAAQREWIDHQRKMSRLARRDSLTALPNRLHLQRLLPRLLARAARGKGRIALLHLDLDHFKNVNDSLGHGIGDCLLTTMAQRLRASVSAHDLVVRMGADEFLVVATALPSSVVVDPIAERLRSVLAAPVEIDGTVLLMSASIGISVYPDDGTNPEQLLRHADIALHTAKDQGRGTHRFYTPDMNIRLRERVGLERALRRALDHDELTVEYQPCLELQTLRTASLEALARWRSPEGSLIPPSRFIPIAEQSNLIIELGEHVLRKVFLQLSEWQRERLPLVPVSVNISVRQLEKTPLASVVAGLSQQYGVDASLVHFEITESAAMQNSQQPLGALQALRNLGSRILIDDFGTGYSSLSYLKHLPIDTLKIDRAFVRDMAVDANDAAIVRAIAAVARSLGMGLVAEGIESEEQLDCLRKLGCEYGQGFLFSPAVSADACRSILSGSRSRVVAEAPKLRWLNPVG